VDIGAARGRARLCALWRGPVPQVWAVDINPQALRLTRINAALAGVQLKRSHSDLLKNVEGEFDLIVANPALSC
jgi:methylase of polypeptide subunit release factors